MAGGGADGPEPGDGYRIEIAEVRKIMKPMEESVVAAHKIKQDWKSMAQGIQNAATVDIEKPAKDVLSEWGFGMGRLAEHADSIVEGLRQAIAAYMMADLLQLENFAPTGRQAPCLCGRVQGRLRQADRLVPAAVDRCRGR
ncbi:MULTISPECIES: hypothetical protein [unclassified Streptomyces]|uniref:hypothetical protein n=1 Tax=unclassified Streptomyces TaxID=2593676 RepID=UPI002F91BE67